MRLLILVYFVVIYFFGSGGDEFRGSLLDPTLSIIYGSGLNPHLVLPTRYFYIQAVDSVGKK